mgnify:CR=1 FL=1
MKQLPNDIPRCQGIGCKMTKVCARAQRHVDQDREAYVWYAAFDNHLTGDGCADIITIGDLPPKR